MDNQSTVGPMELSILLSSPFTGVSVAGGATIFDWTLSPSHRAQRGARAVSNLLIAVVAGEGMTQQSPRLQPTDWPGMTQHCGPATLQPTLLRLRCHQVANQIIFYDFC